MTTVPSHGQARCTSTRYSETSLSLRLSLTSPLSLPVSLQDIFVCRSCGLTDSLCCCTECAYTCHRGHDCVFKKASPTAYCDCWERCRCHSLAQTPDAPRLALLQRVMAVTPLATKVSPFPPSLVLSPHSHSYSLTA